MVVTAAGRGEVVVDGGGLALELRRARTRRPSPGGRPRRGAGGRRAREPRRRTRWAAADELARHLGGQLGAQGVLEPRRSRHPPRSRAAPAGQRGPGARWRCAVARRRWLGVAGRPRGHRGRRGRRRPGGTRELRKSANPRPSRAASARGEVRIRQVRPADDAVLPAVRVHAWKIGLDDALPHDRKLSRPGGGTAPTLKGTRAVQAQGRGRRVRPARRATPSVADRVAAMASTNCSPGLTKSRVVVVPGERAAARAARRSPSARAPPTGRRPGPRRRRPPRGACARRRGSVPSRRSAPAPGRRGSIVAHVVAQLGVAREPERAGHRRHPEAQRRRGVACDTGARRPSWVAGRTVIRAPATSRSSPGAAGQHRPVPEAAPGTSPRPAARRSGRRAGTAQRREVEVVVVQVGDQHHVGVVRHAVGGCGVPAQVEEPVREQRVGGHADAAQLDGRGGVSPPGDPSSGPASVTMATSSSQRYGDRPGRRVP